MRKQKGITLIALIITIIIMMILVGVTVTVAIKGELFDKAKQAATGMTMAQIKEKAEMVKHEFFIEKESGSSTIMGTKAKYIERLKTEFGVTDAEVKGNKVIVADGKYDIIVKNSNLDIEVVEHSDYVDVSSIASLTCDYKNLEDDNKVYAIKVLINPSQNIDESEYVLQEYEKNLGDKEEVTYQEKKDIVLDLASEQLTETKGETTTIETVDEYFVEMFNLIAIEKGINHDNQDLDNWIEDENLPAMLELPSDIVVTRSVLYNWALSANDLTVETTEEQFVEKAYYYMVQKEQEDEEKNIYVEEYRKNTNNLNLYVMYNGTKTNIAKTIGVGSVEHKYFITENGEYKFILEDSEGNEIASETIVASNVEKSEYVLTEEEAEGVWRINSSGSIEYLGDEKSVVVPMCIGQKEIDTISGYAFAGKSLEEIKIPETIISVGEYAFYKCSSLESITIPDSVRFWTPNIFKDCTALKEVKLSNSLKEIESNTFANCTSLQNITIPNSVERIYYRAFYGCSSLKSIVIPNSVTRMDSQVFYNCSSLESVTIPSSVTYLDAATFYNCSSLKSITIPDTVTNIETLSLFYGCSSLTNVTLPSSTTTISKDTFHDCTSLTEITIPDNVTGINSNAFWGCSLLTDITIPESVTKIGSMAFYNCTSLQNITIPNSVTTIEHSVFSGCEKLENIYFAKGTNTIPSGQPWGAPKGENVNVEKLTSQANTAE